MTLQYVGPGCNPARTILMPFSDDPDWEDPAVPAPTDECWAMALALNVPSKAVITFAFYDAGDLQVLGGTADAYEFYVTPPYGFGFGTASTKRHVVTKGQVVVAMDLSKGWLATIVGPQPHGLRFSNIVAPAGAVKLCVSVQQRPPR
jgi:hypothetical protein